MNTMNGLFRVGVVGSVVAALCCAGILTPLLAAGLTAAGLGALTRNLDLVIFPALAVFLTLTAVGWWLRQRREPREQQERTAIAGSDEGV